MASQDSIIQTISTIYKEQFDGDPSEIEMSTRLRDLELDSIDSYELILSIETELNIDIPEHDYDGFKTVGDVVNYLREKA
jgi:acyl carrier protein